MKYFTRSLLDSSGSTEAACAKWNSVLQRYKAYVDSVFSKLPESVQEYERCNYHDESVTAIEYDNRGKTLRIELDECCRLAFSGVKRVRMTELSASMDDPEVWLYDEIELMPDERTVELRVLFEAGEIAFQASSVKRHEWGE